ncbi:MAG: FAD-dependent thymidylate synthase [Desulfurococcaceae archaeon]
MSEGCSPRARLITWNVVGERLVAAAAKSTISARSFAEIFDRLEDGKVREWLRELVRRGHGSPLEHSSYTFEVVCSRACSHQLVRHRIASYSQLSQRYTDKYLRTLAERACKAVNVECRGPKEFSEALIKASGTLGRDELSGLVCEAFVVPPSLLASDEFLRSLVRGAASYYEAISKGANYEDARYLLPQAIKTRLVVSMNARELLEAFLPLRMCAKAQWEIRHVAWGLWRELVKVHPGIFSYAGPRCILYDVMTRDADACTLEEYVRGLCKPSIERCPELVPRDSIPRCLRALWNRHVEKL